MRFELARLAALGSVVLLVGCMDRTPVAPTANAIVVHAVLDPSTRDQYVVVQTAPGRVDDARALTGAAVVLILPDGRRVTAAEETNKGTVLLKSFATMPKTIYHFALGQLGFSLVPGATYGLEITAPDGRVVRGHTTVPAAAPATVISPVRNLYMFADTARLTWPRVAAARSYEIAVLPENPNASTPQAILVDTAVALFADLRTANGGDLFTTGFVNDVDVTAVDSNYYDYYRRSSDIFTGIGLINHLDGANGLFGSVVIIARHRYSVFDTSTHRK